MDLHDTKTECRSALFLLGQSVKYLAETHDNPCLGNITDIISNMMPCLDVFDTSPLVAPRICPTRTALENFNSYLLHIAKLGLIKRSLTPPSINKQLKQQLIKAHQILNTALKAYAPKDTDQKTIQERQTAQARLHDVYETQNRLYAKDPQTASQDTQRFYQLLADIKSYAWSLGCKSNTIFLSWAWYMNAFPEDKNVPRFVEQFTDHLRCAGLTPIFDGYESHTGGNPQLFMLQAKNADYIFYFGTKTMLYKHYYDPAAMVHAEVEYIFERRRKNPDDDTVLPMLLGDDFETGMLPEFIRHYAFADISKIGYEQHLLATLCQLYFGADEHPTVTRLIDDYLQQRPRQPTQTSPLQQHSFMGAKAPKQAPIQKSPQTKGTSTQPPSGGTSTILFNLPGSSLTTSKFTLVVNNHTPTPPPMEAIRGNEGTQLNLGETKTTVNNFK